MEVGGAEEKLSDTELIPDERDGDYAQFIPVDGDQRPSVIEALRLRVSSLGRILTRLSRNPVIALVGFLAAIVALFQFFSPVEDRMLSPPSWHQLRATTFHRLNLAQILPVPPLLHDRLDTELGPLYPGADPRFYRAKAIVFAALNDQYDGQLGLASIAIDVLTKGLHMLPRNPEMLFERGVLYARQKRFVEATNDFHKAKHLLASSRYSTYPAAISIDVALAGIDFDNQQYFTAIQKYKDILRVIGNSTRSEDISYLPVTDFEVLMYNASNGGFVSLSSKYAVPVINFQLGTALFAVQRFDEGSKHIEMAMEGFDGARFTSSSIIILKLQYVAALITNGKLDRAETILRDVESLVDIQPVNDGWEINLKLSAMYMRAIYSSIFRGNVDIGIETLKDAALIISNTDGVWPEVAFNVQRDLAVLYLVNDRDALGVELLQRAVRLADEIGNPVWKFQAAFANALIAYRVSDSKRLENAVDVMEEQFGISEGLGDDSRGFLLFVRSLQADLAENHVSSERMKKKAIEFLQTNANLHRDFLGVLDPSIKTE